MNLERIRNIRMTEKERKR